MPHGCPAIHCGVAWTGLIPTPTPTPLIPTPTIGSISVSSSPSGASIYLDGSYQGITPMTIKNVEAGSYTITLKHTDYQDWSDTISVRAGDTTYVSPSLPLKPTPIPTTGSISVSSSPAGASTYLDGSYKGTTPMTIKNVEAGSYTITLKHTDYQDWSDTINVRAGDTTYVSPSLPPKPTPIPTDTISNFRVISSSDNYIDIIVDYSYNTDHGDNPGIGPNVLSGGQVSMFFGYSCEQEGVHCVDIYRGTGSATIHVFFSNYNNPPASVITDQIQLQFYDDSGFFYSKEFDYTKTWSNPLP